MADTILIPITIEEQSIAAPVTVETQTITAPLSLVEQSISAPLQVVAQAISAPVTELQNVINAPITIGEMGPRGEQGIQGLPGPAGATVVQYEAAIPIGGHRVVVLESSLVVYADSSVAAHANKILGLSIGAVDAGGMASIQTGGEIEEPSWAWQPDFPIFLGINGLLTQTVPEAGFSLIVGFPITTTRIFINLREPLIL